VTPFAAALIDNLRYRLGGGPWAAAMVLGSGLGPLADQLEQCRVVPYADIPGLPAPTAAGHAGRLVSGRLAGVPLLLFQGRFHQYEGLTAAAAAAPVALASALGCPRLLLTNAVGVIRPDWQPGGFMWVEDHLNLSGDNPLRGVRNHPFLDLTQLYCNELFPPLQAALAAEQLPLYRGVLCMLAGPSYETPAEIRMLSRLGADVVSMSTVNEAILGRWLGMEVVALSLLANPAAGLGADVLDHADVLAVGHGAVRSLERIVRLLLPLWLGESGTGPSR